MNRAEKREVVEELGEAFSNASVVLVVGYRGLNVAQMTNLRRQVREAGASIRVAKNRLAKLAVADAPCSGIGPLFRGPTAIATAEDPVGVARVLCDFAKEHRNLVLLGGSMGSQRLLDPGRIEALSKLPSLEALRASLIGAIQAPAAKLVRTISEPGARVARVMAAKGDAEAS